MKRIAIEFDTEDQASYIPQVENLVTKLGFTPEILSSEQIISGELFNFDAVIFPGGMGAFYGLRNYEDFDAAIRYFVANGGGYMGVCGGAYVAGLSMSETIRTYCPKTLGLIDVKIVSPPWIKYISEYRQVTGERVAVTCKVTEEPHQIVIPYQGETICIAYSGGPLITEVAPEVTPLLTYIDDIMPFGNVALCCSVFGKGRVVISSPHPEAPWGEEKVNTGCQEWLYLNMISWISQAEEQAYFPFLPWLVKKRLIPYPAIPTSFALGLGVVTTLALSRFFKRKP